VLGECFPSYNAGFMTEALSSSRNMFGRKADPQGKQEIVNLLSRPSLASKEIDTAVDGIKMQIA